MIAAVCKHERKQKHGKTKAGTARLRCKDCGRTFTESTALFDGMRIGMDRAEQIIKLLCEGMSIAATARVTYTDPHTVIDLMVLVGNRCEEFLEAEIQGVHVDDVQVDEIWQFIFCKHRTAELKNYVGGAGDSYCFTGIERNTKLLVAWHLGRRTQADTGTFCAKLRRATTGRFQLSTDGFGAYPQAIVWNFQGKVDYGMLVKTFGEAPKDDRRKYSPATIISAKKRAIYGKPDEDRICTSHAERMNGSIRTFVKRMGRLTYCFSKRWDNHRAALGLFFAHYNFCRKHRSLGRETPAMASGLADHAWTVREFLEAIAAL